MRLEGTPSDPLPTPAGLSLLIQTSLLPLPSSPSPPLGCIQDPPLPPPPCLHTHESLPSPSPGVPSSSPPLHCLPRPDPSLDASAESSQPRFLGQITLQSFLGRASRTRTSRAPRRAQHSHTWGLSHPSPCPRGGSRDSSRDQAPPQACVQGPPLSPPEVSGHDLWAGSSARDPAPSRCKSIVSSLLFCPGSHILLSLWIC